MGTPGSFLPPRDEGRARQLRRDHTFGRQRGAGSHSLEAANCLAHPPAARANPIRFESIRRNEVGSKISAGKVASAIRAKSTEGLQLLVDEDRQQRAATLLKDVAYVIEASIELTAKGRADRAETVQKHLDIARRRAAKGQYFHHPYLGTREFACDFELLEGPPPPPHESLLGERDLGWMALDLDYTAGMQARFFRARMIDGVIDVPALDDATVAG